MVKMLSAMRTLYGHEMITALSGNFVENLVMLVIYDVMKFAI